MGTMNQMAVEDSGGSLVELAIKIFQDAYRLQMAGDLDLAADLYRRSIEIHPTAEAHTYLGFAYRHQGRIEDAIAECERAIAVDPTFGNPYNDIGAYLIELGRHDESIPWLEKATRSERYESFQFPWYNLGRVYVTKEMYRKATECLNNALDIDPEYEVAQKALDRLRRSIQ
jgi:tetratricopeptide (TPR) repeat protein